MILLNLKAELEIRQPHEKLGLSLFHQWDRFVRIPETQLNLLGEVGKRKYQGPVPVRSMKKLME